MTVVIVAAAWTAASIVAAPLIGRWLRHCAEQRPEPPSAPLTRRELL